jgi:predicted TPR repeat methyltransferase
VTFLTERGKHVLLPVQSAYDLTAPFYDKWYWQPFWRAAEYPPILEAIQRFRRGRGRSIDILDVGCGTGWYLDQLKSICRDRVGIDLSGGMLAIARERLGNTLLKRADGRKIPFAKSRFDAVLCTRVISHMPQIGAAILEMKKVLGDGGLLIISDVDAEHDYEYTRLPIQSGHVFVDTFKHPQQAVFDEVERVGFVLDTRIVIHLDGTTERLGPRRKSRRMSPVAGWIGIWRKLSL